MNRDDDFVPVTGGVNLADEDVRDDLGMLRDVQVQSDLDLHIVRLLALHPQLRVRFRNQDLTRLSRAAKQSLLQEMNDLLGIKPLRTRDAEAVEHATSESPASCSSG